MCLYMCNVLRLCSYKMTAKTVFNVYCLCCHFCAACHFFSMSAITCFRFLPSLR